MSERSRRFKISLSDDSDTNEFPPSFSGSDDDTKQVTKRKQLLGKRKRRRNDTHDNDEQDSSSDKGTRVLKPLCTRRRILDDEIEGAESGSDASSIGLSDTTDEDSQQGRVRARRRVARRTCGRAQTSDDDQDSSNESAGVLKSDQTGRRILDDEDQENEEDSFNSDVSSIGLSDTTDEDMKEELRERRRLVKTRREQDSSDENTAVLLKPLHTGRRILTDEDHENAAAESDSDVSSTGLSDTTDEDMKKELLRKRRRVALRSRGREEPSLNDQESIISGYKGTDEDDNDTCSSISLDSMGCTPGQLYCSWCQEPKALDSFSTRQQRNSDNSNGYCLLHTSGPQTNYVDRLERKVEENLMDTDRDGEAEEEDVHVDDTPKKGNLHYGAWYRGTNSSNTAPGSNEGRSEHIVHETPLDKMTKKYDEIFAKARSSAGAHSHDFCSEEDGSEDVIEIDSIHSTEDEEENEGEDGEENDDTSGETSEGEC